MKTDWHSVKEKLPEKGQRVIACYLGVYPHRIVTFWKDAGGAPHFGHPNEADGKGSQPATHWHALPELPNTSSVARRRRNPGDGQ